MPLRHGREQPPDLAAVRGPGLRLLGQEYRHGRRQSIRSGWNGVRPVTGPRLCAALDQDETPATSSGLDLAVAPSSGDTSFALCSLLGPAPLQYLAGRTARASGDQARELRPEAVAAPLAAHQGLAKVRPAEG